MPPFFSVGVSINAPTTAATISSRSRLLTSSRRSSEPPALGVDAAPVRGTVVGVQAFLRGSLVNWHELQVQANSRPGVKTSPHRVNEDVGGCKMRGRLRMPRLPPFESRERVVFFLGARKFDPRDLRDAPARRLDTGRVVAVLLVVRWPGGVR